MLKSTNNAEKPGWLTVLGYSWSRLVIWSKLKWGRGHTHHSRYAQGIGPCLAQSLGVSQAASQASESGPEQMSPQAHPALGTCPQGFHRTPELTSSACLRTRTPKDGQGLRLKDPLPLFPPQPPPVPGWAGLALDYLHPCPVCWFPSLLARMASCMALTPPKPSPAPPLLISPSSWPGGHSRSGSSRQAGLVCRILSHWLQLPEGAWRADRTA